MFNSTYQTYLQIKRMQHEKTQKIIKYKTESTKQY